MAWSQEEINIMTDMARELQRYWIMDVDKDIVINCRTKKHNSDGSLCMVCIDIVETLDPTGLEWVELTEGEQEKYITYFSKYPRD